MNTLSSLLNFIGKSSIVVGEIKMFAGRTIPSGWALCGGQAISRTTHSKLFRVLGTTYGAGDGSTTFNLPDLRDKFPVGAGSSYSTGDKGGSATHHHSTANHTLTVNEIPSHNHRLWERGVYDGSGGAHATIYWQEGSAITTQNTGGGQPHNHGNTGDESNIPPYIGINYIIYTGV